MLKYAVASVVLALGFAVSLPPASAAPRERRWRDCRAARSHTTARNRRGSGRRWIGRTPDAVTDAPATQYAPVRQSAPVSERAPGCRTPGRDARPGNAPIVRRRGATTAPRSSRTAAMSINRASSTPRASFKSRRGRERSTSSSFRRMKPATSAWSSTTTGSSRKKSATCGARRPTGAPVHQYVPQYRPVQQVQTVLVPVARRRCSNCGCPCTCSRRPRRLRLGHDLRLSARLCLRRPTRLDAEGLGSGGRAHRLRLSVTRHAGGRGAVTGPRIGCSSGFGVGGPERDRTADLLIANEALSQLSYRPQPRAHGSSGARIELPPFTAGPSGLSTTARGVAEPRNPLEIAPNCASFPRRCKPLFVIVPDQGWAMAENPFLWLIES